MLNKLIVSLIVFACPCSALALNVVNNGQHSIDFHGYVRTGIGLSEHGDTQAFFQLPGTRSKYRLGNEPETNVELELDYIYDLNLSGNDKANIETVIMFDGFKRFDDGTSFELDNLAQGYVRLNHVFNNDLKLWFGKRYYQRKNIYIMNYYWVNSGQNTEFGLGFEDLAAGPGKLDVAVFKSKDDFKLANVAHQIDNASLDARLHDIKLNETSSLTLWGKLARRDKEDTLNYSQESGYGIGFWVDHKRKNFSNTSIMLYQTGAAITPSGVRPNSVREDQGWDLGDASIFEVSNFLHYDALPKMSFQWSLLYRHEERGTAGDPSLDWYSTGIRPVFYLSKNFSLALDAGIDYVDDEVNNRSGSLTKFTTALQISPDRGFKSRPVVKLFLTLADWDGDFKGLVGTVPGNAPYADKTQGWSAGVQFETSW